MHQPRLNLERSKLILYLSSLPPLILLRAWLFPILFALTVSFPAKVMGHPVTFLDGFMPVVSISGDDYNLHSAYTFSANEAIGAHVESVKSRTERYTYSALSYNNRLARWNNPDSQANLYSWIGPVVVAFEGESRGGGMLGAQLDWESRRYYTALEAQQIAIANGPDSSFAKARLGVAPYLAPFDGVHTFLIGEVQHKNTNHQDTLEVTPFIRLFYHSFLTEVGVSTNGTISGSLMAQFYF